MIFKNTLRLSILIFQLLFVSFNSFSQEIKLLQGKISADTNSVGNIHIVNLNLETGTTSNNSGEFIINARPGDTLFFSAVQYEHKKMVVSEEDFENVMKVELREKLNELAEIRLDNIKLSGVLSKDIDKVPKSIYEKLGMPFPKPRRTSLELTAHSARNGGNLTTLFNLINGKFKQLKKAEENTERAKLVNKGLALVGGAFFITQLQLEENEIINFLFFCVDDPEYIENVQSESLMKLLQLFEDKIEAFKALRELD